MRRQTRNFSVVISALLFSLFCSKSPQDTTARVQKVIPQETSKPEDKTPATSGIKLEEEDTSDVVSLPSIQADYDLVRTKLPCLSRLESLNQAFFSLLAEYATLVLKPDWIKNEDDIKSFQQERESFIERINNFQVFFSFIDNELAKWNFKNRSGDFEHFEEELKMIGIDFVSAEGMLTGFTTAPILEKVISRVASEPYRLYIQMKEAYARSYGSEYTYLDLEPEMKTIYIGEQLLELYPDSEYADLAREILSDALFPLTDYHRMLNSLDEVQSSNRVDEKDYLYIVGELYTNVFPWWTDISEPRKFLELYPDSRFKDVIEKIADNPSEVFRGDRVFVVATDRFNDEQSARQAVLSYFLQGLDIPHVLTISEDNYVVAYRFFACSEKAQKALEEIKSIKSEAYIFWKVPSGR